jgi:hypothetical protein
MSLPRRYALHRVQHLQTATSWYIDKLPVRKLTVEVDDCDECIALGFSGEGTAIILGPRGKPTEKSGSLLYTSKLRRARELLAWRGVQSTEVRQDRQGTHHFKIRDLEGNVIEISEEP